jgi:hypothetical protein
MLGRSLFCVGRVSEFPICRFAASVPDLKKTHWTPSEKIAADFRQLPSAG